MKSILFAVLFGLVLGGVSRADLLVPKPTFLTVSNLQSFPTYKFLYTTEFGTEAKGLHRLTNGATYEIRDQARLYVQDAGGHLQPWTTVHASGKTQYLTLTVQDIQLKDRKIVVIHKVSVTDVPVKKGNAMNGDGARPFTTPFLLASFGVCGLVVLARRQRPAA